MTAIERIRLAMKSRATSLDLSNCNLRAIPKTLFKMDWLEELNLSSYIYHDAHSNKIAVLPPEMGNLQNLKTLLLKGNNVSDVSNLANCPNLRKLDISNNQLQSCESLQELTSLISLDLKSNNFSSIEEIRNLINLEELDLSYSKVFDFSILSVLINLRDLNLRNSK